MRIAFSSLLLFICLLLAGSEPARARVVEEVQYSFFLQFAGNEVASAQFFVPTFVTADVTIAAKQLESCQFGGLPCGNVTLLPDFTESGQSFDVFQIEPLGDPPVGYGFPLGSFQSFGINFDVKGQALLSVKQIPVTVPEPPTLSLLLTGAGLLGLGLWRRANTATSLTRGGHAAA
jgi:hypothetical protein